MLTVERYIGAHDASTSTTTYFSIPFAYSSRFEPSKLIDTKEDLTADALVNATTHGPACINFNLPPPYDKGFGLLLGTDPIKPSSEDCLAMDVYVPDGDYSDLPVLFYTPGGGFLVGASFPYDMKPLVGRAAAIGKPFIGVVINHRLGPLGFLNPSTWGNATNLGLLDQVNALRYVKKYIPAFGGDPEKVTISTSLYPGCQFRAMTDGTCSGRICWRRVGNASDALDRRGTLPIGLVNECSSIVSKRLSPDS